MVTRTFIAVPLDEVIVARLVEAQRRLAAADAQVRWVVRQNLHLTVKFLGDVAETRLHEVCRVAAEVGRQVQPFEFAVGGLVAVPPGGQVRMVWAGIEEYTGELAKLNALSERAYAELGYKAENRRFHPHLTLGRVKSGCNADALRAAVAEFADADFGLQPAERVIVFASQLTPDGPVYSPLTKVRLGQGAVGTLPE
jgi:2'-5' RNA ligase